MLFKFQFRLKPSDNDSDLRSFHWAFNYIDSHIMWINVYTIWIESFQSHTIIALYGLRRDIATGVCQSIFIII